MNPPAQVRASRNLPLRLMMGEYERILKRRLKVVGGSENDPALHHMLQGFRCTPTDTRLCRFVLPTAPIHSPCWGPGGAPDSFAIGAGAAFEPAEVVLARLCSGNSRNLHPVVSVTSKQSSSVS